MLFFGGGLDVLVGLPVSRVCVFWCFAVVVVLPVLVFSCGFLVGCGVVVIHFCIFRWFACGGGVGFGF